VQWRDLSLSTDFRCAWRDRPADGPPL